MSVLFRADEAERLEALQRYAVLDTPPEVAFDRITGLAARLFNVPIVLVSLVDAQREWFKSVHGLNLRELPRDVSFCRYIVLAGEAMVVPDAMEDSRFADNPLVTGSPEFRYYAGAPLKTADGFCLGALCIIDKVPRAPLSDPERRTLEDLAAIVVDELDLRVSAAKLHREMVERESLDKALRESDEHFRQRAEALDDCVWISSTDTSENLYVSPAYETIWGRSRQEFEENSHAWSDAIHPDDRERVLELWTSPKASAGDYNAEYRIVRPDGGTRWIWDRAFSIRNARGETYRLAGLATDITARKQAEAEIRGLNARLEQRVVERTARLEAANQELENEIAERQRVEEALRASEERWRIISEMTSDFSYAYLLQADGTIIRQWTTDAFTRITGYAPEELDARGWEHLYHCADQHLFAARMEAIASGRPDVSEFRILSKSGEVRWLRDSVRPLVGVAPDGATLVYGATQDITDHKLAEAAVRSSERKYRLLMEQAADGIFVADADGNYVEVNPTGCRMLGYTREEMLDRNIRDLIPADDQARTPIRWTALHSGESIIAERRLLRKDGALLSVEISAKRLDNGDLQALVRDITARKQAEARLRESERRLAEAQRLAHLGAWEWDMRTNRVTWSDELYRIFGLQPGQFDATYEAFQKHIHPDDRAHISQAVRHALQGRQPYLDEHRIVRSDGATRIIRPRAEVELDAQGRPVRMVGTAHDVTEQKEVEIRAQREAARTEVLLRVAARLNAELEVDAVLNALCEETADVLGVPIVYVVLHESGGPANVYAAGLGVPPAYAQHLLPVPHTSYDAYRREPDRIIIPDVSAIGGMPNAELHAALSIRTTVMMNIMRQRALVGALVIMTREVVREFTDDELALLRGLADQAAQAVVTAQLFEQVRMSRERLRRLTRQVVSAQEEERRRLSRELHDEAGQALTGLEISLKLIDADLPSSPSGLRQRLADAIALTGTTMDQIRLLAQDLRPPALDAVGLNLTLEGYCRGFAARTGLAVDYAGMEVPEVSDTINITLYRVLQEALTNVVKHAHARQVRVALGYAVGTLMLLIVDDGRGFDKQALAPGSRPATGIGLIGMQERVELLGGRLEIDAGRRHGTRLAAYVPLE